MDTSGDGNIGPDELINAFDSFFFNATENKDSSGEVSKVFSKDKEKNVYLYKTIEIDEESKKEHELEVEIPELDKKEACEIMKNVDGSGNVTFRNFILASIETSFEAIE